MGWIALHSGMAAGAHAILIPEQKTSMDQIATWVQSVVDRGRAPLSSWPRASTSTPWMTPTPSADSTHSGAPASAASANLIAPEIEARVGIETRATTRPHPARRHPDRLRP
jgi:6-phosphofructokinase 1